MPYYKIIAGGVEFRYYPERYESGRLRIGNNSGSWWITEDGAKGLVAFWRDRHSTSSKEDCTQIHGVRYKYQAGCHPFKIDRYNANGFHELSVEEVNTAINFWATHGVEVRAI